MKKQHRIGRVYPRLQMGGAENAIIQLLEQIGDTHMIVTHVDGMRAEKAKALADRYTLLGKPRFCGLLEALSEVEVVHIHTINDHPLIPLAAQLSGAPTIVQTVHNHFSPKYCHFVDHSIVVGLELLDRVVTPGRTTHISNGVACPKTLPPFQPWFVEDRPVRLVELRRPDKQMSFTVEELVMDGALDGLDFVVDVVGVDKPSSHPNVRYLGPRKDPTEFVGMADFLVMGTELETFGRTVYEAMALGTIPIATPVQAFTQVFSEGEVVFFSSHDRQTAGKELRACIERMKGDQQRYQQMRERNHRRVASQFSIEAMAMATDAVVRVQQTIPPVARNYLADDLTGGDVQLFGAIVDDLLESTTPSMLGDVRNLPPKMQGLVYWILADQQRVPEAKAVELWHAALQRLGPRPLLCEQLGSALIDRGKTTEGLHLLESSLALDSGVVTPHILVMETHVNEGRFDSARAALARARQALPTHRFFARLEARLQGDHHMLQGGSAS